MVVVVPVPGSLLLIMLIGGVALAIAGGLIHRLSGRKRANNLMWFGIAFAGLCEIGFLLGALTGG